MKLAWTKGLSADAKKEMQSSFNSSSLTRLRLTLLLKEKIESMRKKNTLEDAYENPNWALKQADAVGYERALNEIISLIS